MKAWGALEQGISTAVLAWHRRAGKDEIALHNAACKAVERVGNYWHMLPQQEQARKAIWEAVNPRTGRIRWADAFPDEIIAHRDNESMKLTLKNGSTWQVLGSDNYNSLVGTTPVGMTFSEAALADPAAFGFFSPILLENNGWSVHISSVRGRNHFYDMFKAFENAPDAFVEILSAEDTDVFTPAQLEGERLMMRQLYGAAIGESTFDQEYLSSWDAATIGAVFGEEIATLRAEGRALPIGYDSRYPVDTAWDIGVGDTNVVLFFQTVGNFERLIDWYSSNATGLQHYAQVLSEKPYYYGVHVGPHDIANREWGANGVSRMAIAKKLGINFLRMPNVPKSDSIASASRLMERLFVNSGETTPKDPMDDCTFVLDAFSQYRFQFDKVRRVMSKNPVHDWTSHYSDALMTYALYCEGFKTGKRALQGVLPEVQHQNKTRLRDIMRNRTNVKGAWG